MNESRQSTPRGIWRGRIIFLIIVAIFIVPIIAAWWLFKNVDPGKPWGTSNAGTLINPPQPLSSFQVKNANNADYFLENLQGKWTMVFMPPSNCLEACRKNIYHMRQVWAGLGREAPRVRRLLVFRGEQQYAELAEFLLNYEGMDVVLDKDGLLIRQIQAREPVTNTNIFLVDPLGNLMMAFPQTLDPRDVLKDVKKLLKISTIG